MYIAIRILRQTQDERKNNFNPVRGEPVEPYRTQLKVMILIFIMKVVYV